jgi:hypothetical protein
MFASEVPSGTSFFMQRRWSLAAIGLSLPLLLVFGAALLFSHPFTGVRHDGVLYAGDALARLEQGQFHDDLYFQFGSQGRFTILPAFYAQLIAWFGLGAGTKVGLLFAFALDLFAIGFTVSALLPQRLRTWGIASVILGWSLYGGLRIFAYAEPFLTSRSFAEPFVLFAVGLMLRNRMIPAALALAFALLMHPLMAACGVVVYWAMLVQRDRRWTWLAVPAVAGLAALGALGLGPFSDLYARYDPEWLAIVREVNVHAFVFLWSLTDFGIVVWAVVVLVLFYRQTIDPLQRRLVVAVVATGLVSLAASALLVDVASSVFFGKLQIWRALWLMQWVAMAALPAVVLPLWRRDDHGRVIASLLAIGWIAPFTIAPGIVALMALAIELFRHRMAVSRPTVRIVVGALVATALVVLCQFELRFAKLAFALDQPITRIFGQAFASAVLLTGLIVAFAKAAPRLRGAALPIALVVFVVAAFAWDQRSPWTRAIEAQPVGTYIWPGVIEPEAKVYWYRDMIAPWVLLGHANYYTQQQGSGAVFSRPMTIELEKRSHIAALLELQEQICRMMNSLNNNEHSCEPDVAATKTICEEGNVDYVVLQSRIEGEKPVADYATGVTENGYEKRFFLYRCSLLNKG